MVAIVISIRYAPSSVSWASFSDCLLSSWHSLIPYIHMGDVLVFGALGQRTLLCDALDVPVLWILSHALLVELQLEPTVLGHECYGVVCYVHVEDGHSMLN